MAEELNHIPNLTSSLRHILHVPSACYEAGGIVINGRRIKSLVFTTDIAIIRNCDADAVFAVYPFTPQQAISDAIIRSSYIPVFCGCGGGTTKGRTSHRIPRQGCRIPGSHGCGLECSYF